MKKLMLAALLGVSLAACDDGRDRDGAYEDTPPSGEGKPAQDIERQPARPDAGATGT